MLVSLNESSFPCIQILFLVPSASYDCFWYIPFSCPRRNKGIFSRSRPSKVHSSSTPPIMAVYCRYHYKYIITEDPRCRKKRLENHSHNVSSSHIVCPSPHQWPNAKHFPLLNFPAAISFLSCIKTLAARQALPDTHQGSPQRPKGPGIDPFPSFTPEFRFCCTSQNRRTSCFISLNPE